MSNKNSGKQQPKKQESRPKVPKKDDPRTTTELQSIREGDRPNQ
jgi:hypothetical protein